ncbi:ethanolaminephosphotransferase 1-like [Trichoplusia ni]|uniref:Ethanolaminephosphotransferase 1-like n=1 Tax=Trichoplusia ni TaxID=7111 RepID=A0A7E5VIM0_TRINI|nr:ethanolaminephosphotransferase 1-like [Trichoplusia ni]
MFDYKYLSKDHLKGFNKYKYSAIDTSPLSQYVMHPTWNTIVKIIPKWVAPNVITFAGFLCMVVSMVLLTVYDYELYAVGGRPGAKPYASEIPNWVFFACSVLVFLAYNLDGIDGKQARRIGVSGPLGELFDHGLDSYIVFLIPYTIISIYGRDPVFSVSCFRGFLIVLSIVMNFYVSHCEKYNTGTLYLPWSYDLSMWISSILFLLAGLYGPEYYKVYVFGDVTFVQALEVVIHGMGVITCYPVAVYNVYLSYQNRSGKRYGLLEAVKPVWSLLVVTLLVVMWALKSENNVIELYPRAFIFMYGALFSNIASRLIIAEMSHMKCEVLSWMTWPLLSGFLTSLYLPQLEATILHLLVALFVLSHVHYGVCVVRQICNHLKIRCFIVPKEKRK